MKITILAENTGFASFAAEHGLSMLVEEQGRYFLIDTGASALFAENADRLGLDLARVEAAFLSHAHYDHSGGFAAFFARNETAKVYLQKAAQAKCYYKIVGPLKKYIGIPKGLLEAYPERFAFVERAELPECGISLLPHTTPNLVSRGRHAHMCYTCGGKTQDDDFAHEQTVVFHTGKGLVLFNSCSHGGIENIIEEVKAAFPDEAIRAFFGGFHMMGAGGTATCSFKEEHVKAVADQLLSSSPAVFYSGHCTGNVAFPWLKEVMGDRLIAMHSGMEIKL